MEPGQKIPKRFIQKNIVENMKEGEIGYIDKAISIQLDPTYHLWVRKETKLSPIRESDAIESEGDQELSHALIFSSLGRNI